VSSKDVLTYFNQGKSRIRVISDNLWYIEDFFVFQYGPTFNVNNPMHRGIETIYKKHEIEITSIRGLKEVNLTPKDKVKEKDKDKDSINGADYKKSEGEKFSEDFETVRFRDGTSQKLGVEQKTLASMGGITAKAIIKGVSY
jgi:hypothetical protein